MSRDHHAIGAAEPTVAVNDDGVLTIDGVPVVLDATGADAGTYGATASIPVLTVGTDGRISAATTAEVLPVTYTGPADQDAIAIDDGAGQSVALNTTYGLRVNADSNTAIWVTTDGSGELHVAVDDGGVPSTDSYVVLAGDHFELRNGGSAGVVRFDGTTGKMALGPGFISTDNAVTFQAVGNSAPDMTFPAAPAWGAWVDEAANKLVFAVVYADGTTMKSGSIDLT